ncbi:MAG: hypothetical protein ABI863_06765 [Ginsengibacter sp.]
MRPGKPKSIPDKIVAATNTLENTQPGEIREQLISLINELINNDFDALVQLLYRIDVDEKKLKQLLRSRADVDSASIIADLIISRQLQKSAMKKQFSDGDKPGPDDSW